jgi:hypothetical protein
MEFQQGMTYKLHDSGKLTTAKDLGGCVGLEWQEKTPNTTMNYRKCSGLLWQSTKLFFRQSQSLLEALPAGL